VKGGATFASTVTNTAAAELTVGGAYTITGVLTVGTDGLTIAGAGAVSLTAKPVVADSKAPTISSAGGVTLADGIDVAVAGGLTVENEGKVILPNEKAVTITSLGTVTGGDWTLGTAGSATAIGNITFSAAGIAGSAATAKLALAASVLTVTKATDGGAAALDSVDVYLASSTASVVVSTTSTTDDEAATLTLKNGAKISGSPEAERLPPLLLPRSQQTEPLRISRR
jgi:hypothetical protein